MLRRELGRDQLRDAGIDLELREVDRGHAILARQHLGELGLLNEAELDQVVADASTVLPLLLERLVELLPGDEPLTHEEVTNTLCNGGWCDHVDSRRNEPATRSTGAAQGSVAVYRR